MGDSASLPLLLSGGSVSLPFKDGAVFEVALPPLPLPVGSAAVPLFFRVYSFLASSEFLAATLLMLYIITLRRSTEEIAV